MASWSERDSGESGRRKPSRRSWLALACVAIGLIAAREAGGGWSSVMWFGACAAALAIAAATRGWMCKAALCAACMTLSGGWFTARLLEGRADRLGVWLSVDPLGEPEPMSVLGVVEDWAVDAGASRGALGGFTRADPSCSFSLKVRGVETDESVAAQRTGGRVWVRVGCWGADLPAWLVPGASVQITGRMEGIDGAMNPGEPDWRLLARQDGREGSLDVPDAALIQKGPALNGWSGAEAGLLRMLGGLRRFAAETFRNVTRAGESTGVDGADATTGHGVGTDVRSTQARALLGAMLLGERAPGLEPVNAAFMRLGLLHLVAISGFNLAVMGGVALFLLRLTGDRGWLEPALLALAIGAYLLVLPAQAAIVRSGAMVLALLVVEATGRRYERASVLGWIGVGLLAWRPMDLWSVGFQLSMGIVAVLLVLGDRAREQIFGIEIRGLVRPHMPAGPVRWWGAAVLGRAWRSARSALKTHVSTSVLAWAAATPIIAAHTGVVSPLAAVTSLLVLPITVVVMWVGYTALFVGGVLTLVGASGMAGVLGRVLDWSARILVDVVMTLDRVPGATLHLPRISALLAGACTIVALYWFWRGHTRDRLAWAMTLVVAAWFVGEVWGVRRFREREPLRLDTLAVGDGTCHLLRSGGEAMLWDCGSLALGVGERRVPEAVRALGAWRVERVLITHAHIDHFAGVLDVVEPLGVREVLVGAQMLRWARAMPESAPGVLIAELERRGVTVRELARGDVLTLGRARGEVLWPAREQEFSDPNDASLVARFEVQTRVGPRRALFTGDISKLATPSLLPETPEQAERLKAEVMELPHHGAFLDAKAELVRVVGARVVVQSTGPRRARDARWDQFKAGREWLVTARDGALTTVIADDGEVSVRGFSWAP